MVRCDVSLINGRTLSPITLLGDTIESSCWYGQDLFPGRGYAAAIAIEEITGIFRVGIILYKAF